MSSYVEKIKDGEWDIYLTRGDYFATTVSMVSKATGEPITPTDGSLRFAVKKKYKDSDDKILINKQIPLDTMLLELESADTKSLAFGAYDYDIEYTDAQGHPDTFIGGKLNLTKEVL